MKVLIVSNQFTKGGLETHIYTLYQQLKIDNDFFFAFSKFDSKLEFPSDRLFVDFDFSFSSTITSFCNDVERLVKIINTYKIDVIQVHPSYCLFPTIIASHITKVPMVYTYHGMSSLSFVNEINDTLALELMLNIGTTNILSVTQYGLDFLKTMNCNRGIFLPNSINCGTFKKTCVKSNKKWALISRLDSDKTGEIIKLLSWFPTIDIKQIDIYGTGNEEQIIKEYVEKQKLNVVFKGHVDDLSNKIINKYNGVIGLGRVALEGLCLNYPVLLIGYGKILGLVNKEKYNTLKKYNFVNMYMPEICKEELNESLKNINSNLDEYQLRDIAKMDFDVEVISEEYMDILKKQKLVFKPYVVSLYKEMCNLDKDILNNHKVYESVVVYNLLKNYVKYYNTNFLVNNQFLNVDNMMKVVSYIEKINNENLELRSNLDDNFKKINNLENKFLDLENEIKSVKNDLLLINTKNKKGLCKIFSDNKYYIKKYGVKKWFIKIKSKLLGE